MRSRLPNSILLCIAVLSTSCTSLPDAPATLPDAQWTLPDRYSIVRDQLMIHGDFPLAPQHRLIEELVGRRHDLVRELQLPVVGEPIHVYLFENAKRFHEFMRTYHPNFPPRRAFFIETDTRLIVYAYWGDRVADDLRHEVVHGYLHSATPNLPLWLDEGLAEYFEVPRNRGGLNQMHVDRLRILVQQGQWRPDLRRLERLDSPFEMTQDDYAEAWAWVDFLLGAGPELRGLIPGYLAALRRDGRAEPLSFALGPSLGNTEQALVAHIHSKAGNGTHHAPRDVSLNAPHDVSLTRSVRDSPVPRQP
jgi:hypothetical protein